MTAIGYHAAGEARSLGADRKAGERGLFSRVVRRLFGGTEGGLTYYKLGGESGADTSALDVGAPPGTDVYSPVDGTVVGITPYVVSEEDARRAHRRAAGRSSFTRRHAHPPAA